MFVLMNIRIENLIKEKGQRKREREKVEQK